MRWSVGETPPAEVALHRIAEPVPPGIDLLELDDVRLDVSQLGRIGGTAPLDVRPRLAPQLEKIVSFRETTVLTLDLPSRGDDVLHGQLEMVAPEEGQRPH